MEGSGNVSEWASGINAKTNYPLKIGFYVSPTLMQDEAGNLRVNSLTVDYDIDKFQSQFGSASFTGSDPQVQNTSGNTQPDVENNSGNTAPGVSGTSGSTTPTTIAGVSVWHTLYGLNTTGRGIGYVEENLVGGGSAPVLYTTRGVVYCQNTTGGAVLVQNEFEFPSGSVVQDSSSSLANGGTRRYNVGESSSSNSSGWFYVEDDNNNASRWTGTLENIYSHSHGSHTHADGSYSADTHLHPDGTYNAANHGHPDGSYDINAADIDYISIADDISEAGSVNATSVNIYLDYWNGSSWINKHSVLATGKTLDNDVDISDSGTYPDATGFWRVRVEPITATADFAQGIVKIKYHLDN